MPRILQTDDVLSSAGAVTRRRRASGVAGGLLLLLVVGAADYLTGTEISFSIFYVAPIACVVWFAGRNWGWAFALLSTAFWAAADRFGGHEASHVLIAVWNACVRMGFFALAVEAVSRLRDSLERERLWARTDIMTGLSNRRVFHEVLELERERALRYSHELALAYLDVDDFKRVNDELGHHEGDRVLGVLADLLHTRLRKTDTAARLGGDEFAVLMPETSAPKAEVAMRKVRDELRQVAERERWPVTLSVGVVEFASPPGDVDEMLRVADGLMYEVKRAGKDSIRVTVHAPKERSWGTVESVRAGDDIPESSPRVSRRFRR